LARVTVIPLEQAQARLLALAAPLPIEIVALKDGYGRYLAQDIRAERTQPAADLSAMDGYAIAVADLPGPWRVIGESAAGKPFTGILASGEAVRIFTGAHVPIGADCILIQENTERDEIMLSLKSNINAQIGQHIRLKGSDFKAGECLLTSGVLLNAGALAIAAMAGAGALSVRKRPKISIIATGDELVAPGMPCTLAQIPSSNSVMLAAMLTKLPCDVTDCGIIGDDLPSIEAALLANTDADIIVTIGGASVGDHDLVQAALRNVGADIDFWRVAIKPGKPLMAGKLGNSVVLGLPGNPGSAFVTAFLFLLPLIRHIAGCLAPLPAVHKAILRDDIPATRNRTEFVRGVFDGTDVSQLRYQDSGMVAPLSKANALIISPLLSPITPKGSIVSFYSIDV
jgi:molybdopterin molybdotransferase